MLEWRNTPRQAGLSPAQIVFGHSLRSLVPAHQKSFDVKWHKTQEQYNQKVFQDKKKIEEVYNQSATQLSTLVIGNEVRIQNIKFKLWDTFGIVVGVGRHRDYLIKLPNGKILWRNRRYLRKRLETATGDESNGNNHDEPLRRSSRLRKQ